jgi:mannopine transport system substrate-binding protein
MRRTKRALLLVAAAATIVAGATNLRGQPAAKVSGTMVVASFGGKFAQALDEHYFQPFGHDAGVKVTMDPVGVQMVAKLQAQQAAGNVVWSLVMPHDQDTFAIAARGMLLPLPAEIKREALALYGPKIVSEWALARGLSASVFVCNPAVASRCPKDPAEFWNVKDFPGRRALYANGWLENLMYALQADGVSPEKLFPLDLDRAFRKLDELKPHVQVWWSTGDQSQQIFWDREVAMGVLWDGRAFGLAAQGVKLEISHRGAMLGWGSLAVPKGAPNPEAAWAFMRWYMAHPAAQGAVQRVTGYGESSPLASDHLPADMQRQMASHPDNIKQVVVPDLAWVSQHRPEIVKRWTEWLQK